MATILGITASQYISGPIVFTSDPQVGAVWQLSFEGPRDAIRIASLDWQASGGRVQIEEDGPISRAQVTLSGARNASDPTQPITSEQPTDRWELRSDRVEVSLFDLPNVVAEAERYAASPNQSRAGYRKTIEDNVANGEALSINATEYPLALQVYYRLTRGQDSFPTTRINLVRQRSFTTAYPPPIPANPIPPVYSTTSLVNAFAIPSAVANALPPNPAQKPIGTEWGWLVMDDAYSYVPKNNLVEQTTSWAFAAWDTGIYPHI